MLMMVTAIIPLSATTLSEKTSHPMAIGNSLYAGGLVPIAGCTKSERTLQNNNPSTLKISHSLGSLSSPSWKWVTSAGGTRYDDGSDIAVDLMGNTYVTGMFIGTATFGNTTFSSPMNYNVYVAKLSPSGTWLWATCTGGYQGPEVYGISVDIGRNIYITGWFCQSATFGNTTLDGGAGNVYVAKLSPNGAWQWAICPELKSGNAWAIGCGVDVDCIGNIYITGWMKGTVLFGNTTLKAPHYDDVFVAKLSPRGIWRWATSADCETYKGKAYGFQIAVDFSRNVYIVGWFYGTVSFNNITLTAQGSQGHSDVFVAKLNPRGAWQWATSAGGEGIDIAFGIALDIKRNIYITGSFTALATFGTTTLTGQPSVDTVFVAKLDRNGAWQWATSAGGALRTEGLCIAVDIHKNVYITGWFEGTSTFGGTTLTCYGDADAYIAKLSSNGSWQWADHAGGPGSLTGTRGITVGIGGNVFVIGSFQGTATFGGSTLTSKGDADIFVAKIK
jgi:hypothetical protein